MGCCSSYPPKIPTFNLVCRVWYGFVPIPPIGAPNLDNVPCQLLAGEFVFGVYTPMDMFLKVPAGTNIHYSRTGAFVGADTVECPKGSGHYYRLTYVNDVARGFANQHRFAIMTEAGVPPTPIP